MAEGDTIPPSFPPMGALFEKPYMEIEFEGQLHRIDQLRGGHNGRVAAACASRPPHWDPERERWVVPVENNIIDIDLAQQPGAAFSGEFPLALREAQILSNPRHRYRSVGTLVSVTDQPDRDPVFPVDCEFQMFIRIHVPGKGTVLNTRPFKLVASGITEWPPPIGTVYKNLDDVELYPQWVPYAETFMKPIARIPRGDEAVLTDVFVWPPGGEPPVSTRWITRLFHRLT